MSTKRITISVPSDIAGRIKKAAAGQPVSTWVTSVIEDHLDDAELEREWQRFYDEVKPSRGDVKRAQSVLRRTAKRSARRGAA
jgi:hypothetical protein